MFIATKRALRGFISETSGNQLLTVSLLLISIPAYSSFKNSNTNNKALLLLLISWCLASCGNYNVARGSVVVLIIPRSANKSNKISVMRGSR